MSTDSAWQRPRKQVDSGKVTLTATTQDTERHSIATATLPKVHEWPSTQQASKQVLETADKTIHGDRHEEYGSAEESFGRIAQLWEDYLGVPITAHDVAMLMVLLKVSRSKTDQKLDTYVDMAGYAALGYRVR